MNELTPQTFSELRPELLDEVVRQFRATRNDMLRYGVWNVRNLSDEEFNRIDDRRLFDYFRQDLLETRLENRGRRIDILQIWGWFDDQMKGEVPLLLEGRREAHILIEDKDLEKMRKRMAEVASFMPVLKSGDFDAFRKVKYKLRRTVMRMTYELHHLSKRLDKYRKAHGFGFHRPHHAAVAHHATDVPHVEVPAGESVEAEA